MKNTSPAPGSLASLDEISAAERRIEEVRASELVALKKRRDAEIAIRHPLSVLVEARRATHEKIAILETNLAVCTAKAAELHALRRLAAGRELMCANFGPIAAELQERPDLRDASEQLLVVAQVLDERRAELEKLNGEISAYAEKHGLENAA